MQITYGCDCVCSNHHGYALVPVAFIVMRKGKEIKVCTRCDLIGDKYVARLFDHETECQPFMDYDILGGVIIANLLDEANWNEYMERRNKLAQS